MTMPLDSQAYPNTPAAPSSAPEGYVTPGTIAPPNSTPLTPEEIEARRGNFIELILREVVRGLTGVFFPGAGAAFDQLVDWVQNILPDWIMEPILALIDLLVTVLDLIPVIGPPAGDALAYFASIFGLMRDTTSVAQSSADNANVGVAQLEAKLASGGVPGGILIDDTFSRTGSTPGTDYTVTYFGPGIGDPQTDGNNLIWGSSGGGDRGAFIIHNTPLATEYESVCFVTVGDFPVITNPTHLRLIARCDATLNNRVEASIALGSCSINIVVAGTTTTLATQSVTTAAGDRWTLKVGTTADVREFILYQNTTPVITVTDTGGTSHYGTGYDQVGLVMYANTQFVPPFFFTQVSPPSLQSFTANDRLAAA